MFYSLDKLKPRTKTKIKIFFVGVNENSTPFLYTLNRGEKKTFFLEGERSFLVLLFKVYNKVEISTTTKLIFQFWFQFIQRIEQQSFFSCSTELVSCHVNCVSAFSCFSKKRRRDHTINIALNFQVLFVILELYEGRDKCLDDIKSCTELRM